MDSLKKRYLFKLLSNLMGAVFSAASQIIIPRGLGPKLYGDYSFLTSFFTQATSFADMGTSTCFYTKLSQRLREPSLIVFYMYFSIVASFCVQSFVLILHATSLNNNLLPGVEMKIVYLAAIWGLLIWYVQLFNSVTDAYGLTVSAEMFKVGQRLAMAIAIYLMLVTHQFTLEKLFLVQYGFLIMLSVLFGALLKRSGSVPPFHLLITFVDIRRYIKEFYHYTHPLFTYSCISLLVGIFDRWILQFFGGSIQQGYYGLSSQIGAVCFIFSSSMTPLLMREFAIAHSQGDLERIKVLFTRYIPLLYAVAAYICCFVLIQADKIVYIFGGVSYKTALMTVAIMALYPLHQTYGQLSGSLFYATGQTVLYRNISIFFMVLGVPVTYFLVAPPHLLGFAAGANGLAIKMVATQFVAVNVQLYFNTRYLKTSFSKLFYHQIYSVILLLGISEICRYGADALPLFQMHPIPGFIVSGICYTLMCCATVYFIPRAVGLTRHDIDNYSMGLLRRVRSPNLSK